MLILPMALTLTRLSCMWLDLMTSSKVLSKSFISSCTSFSSRLKFSVENEYSVTVLTPSSTHQSRNSSTLSAPSQCPSHGTMFWLRAHRRFPSMITPTWLGFSPESIWFLSHLS